MAKGKKGKGGGMKPQDMEKRLGTAYDAGYYDGYTAGVVVTHEIWLEVAKRTKGVGPKLYAAFTAKAIEVMGEKHDEKFGKPPEDVKDVRAALQNTEGLDNGERV